MSWGLCLFGPLRMYGALPLPEPHSKGGESEQDIPRIVGGIAKKGKNRQKDRDVE